MHDLKCIQYGTTDIHHFKRFLDLNKDKVNNDINLLIKILTVLIHHCKYRYIPVLLLAITDSKYHDTVIYMLFLDRNDHVKSNVVENMDRNRLMSIMKSMPEKEFSQALSRAKNEDVTKFMNEADRVRQDDVPVAQEVHEQEFNRILEDVIPMDDLKEVVNVNSNIITQSDIVEDGDDSIDSLFDKLDLNNKDQTEADEYSIQTKESKVPDFVSFEKKYISDNKIYSSDGVKTSATDDFWNDDTTEIFKQSLKENNLSSDIEVKN